VASLQKFQLPFTISVPFICLVLFLSRFKSLHSLQQMKIDIADNYTSIINPRKEEGGAGKVEFMPQL